MVMKNRKDQHLQPMLLLWNLYSIYIAKLQNYFDILVKLIKKEYSNASHFKRYVGMNHETEYVQEMRF